MSKSFTFAVALLCGSLSSILIPKIDIQRLKDTGELLYEVQGLMNLPAEEEAITDFQLYKIKCMAVADRLKSMNFIDLEGIASYRDNEVEALQEICKFTEVYVTAKQNPSILRQFTPAFEACSSWIEALEGKSSLNAEFNKLVVESCKNSQDKECVSKDHQQAETSGTEYIKYYLRTFGWKACAVRFLKINVSSLEDRHQHLIERFERLFKIKNKCF